MVVFFFCFFCVFVRKRDKTVASSFDRKLYQCLAEFSDQFGGFLLRFFFFFFLRETQTENRLKRFSDLSLKNLNLKTRRGALKGPRDSLRDVSFFFFFFLLSFFFYGLYPFWGFGSNLGFWGQIWEILDIFEPKLAQKWRVPGRVNFGGLSAYFTHFLAQNPQKWTI